MGRRWVAVWATAAAFVVVGPPHALGAVASFTVDPDPAPVGATVVFDAGASSGVHFEWDLDGDGTFETDTGASRQATRTYTAPGTVVAGLQVTDADGSQAITTRTFSVVGTAVPEPVQDDVTPPVLSGVSISPKKFALGPRPTPGNAFISRAKRGAVLRWTVNEPSQMRVNVERCTFKPRCARFVITAKLHRTVPAGTRSMAFTGRIEDRKLKPGVYRIALVATDNSGNESRPARVTFVIVAR